MSGICGIVNFDGAPADPNILHRMLALRGRRKPSVVRHWVVGNAGFACQQTDLWPAPSLASSSRVNDETGCVADARLDNRDNLRHRLLTGGWSINEDATDAELILAVFKAWGEQGLDCLQGAYAAAIWETGSQQLLLLRDRMGERALYWCETPSVWLFASEPSQLLACGLVARDYNRQRILAHLIGAVPDPVWSFFRDIRRLPEASYLKLIPGRSVLQRMFPVGNR